MFRQTRSSALKKSNILPVQPKKNPDEKIDASELKKFSLYYDDSSDDEELKYDVAERWRDREDSRESIKSKNNLSNDELLSFVAHAAGIKLFYSKEVNQPYFKLKNEILAEKKSDLNSVAQLQQLVLTAFHDAATKAFAVVEKFSAQAEQKQVAEQLAQKKAVFFSDFKNQLNTKIKDNLIIFVRYLKKIKYGKNIKTDELNFIEAQIAKMFADTFKKYFSAGQTKLDRKQVKESLIELVTEKVSEVSKELKFEKLSNVSGKEKALASLNSDNSFPHFYAALKAILEQHTPVRGLVQNMIMSELTNPEQIDKLLYAYLDDLVVLRMKSHNALASKEDSRLKNYLTMSDDALLDELLSGFVRVQHNLLDEALHNFRRPTLGKSHECASANVYGFYANLRLANCSQNRTIANSQKVLFKTDRPMARIWRLNKEIHPAVLETQTVLKSLGRKDQVEDVSSYEGIYEDINQIKQYFVNRNIPVTDVTIAQWLREIFQGAIPRIGNQFEQDEFLNKLQAIAYLLFGCEPVRNPAAHVTNQMLLDLIIANKDWSFEEALTGKKNGVAVDDKLVKRMPMAPEGAVAVARALVADYREFMPYPYTYPGIEDNRGNKFSKSELMKYEARIVRDWLDLTGFNHDKAVKKELAANVMEHVEKHIGKWMGVDNGVKMGLSR